MSSFNRGGQRITGSTNPIWGNYNLPDPDRSGFDLSYNNGFSSQLMDLIPVFAEEVMEGDVMSYGVSDSTDLLPLVTKLRTPLRINYEAFFVSYDDLDPDWRTFYQHKAHKFGQPAVPEQALLIGPHSNASSIRDHITARGSLLDFLGYGTPTGERASGVSYSGADLDEIRCSAYPILAYWRIIADWYQNSLVEDIETDQRYAPMFPKTNGYLSSWSSTVNMPAWSNRILNGGTAADYPHAWRPFKRRYDRDFVSTLAPSKFGGESEPTVSTAGGSFTLSQFKFCEALTRFFTRSNIAGTRYPEFVKSIFGVEIPDANCGRAEYLGSVSFEMTNDGITNMNSAGGGSPATNPYMVLGYEGGHTYGNAQAQLFTDRTFTERGIVIVLKSVSIRPCYPDKRDNKLQRVGRFDFAFPNFGQLEDQPVKVRDIASASASDHGSGSLHSINNTIVGYNERYLDYKVNADEVHSGFAIPSNNPMYKGILFREVDDVLHNTSTTPEEKLLGIQSDSNSSMNRLFRYSEYPNGPIVTNLRNHCKVLRMLPEHNVPLV